MDGKISLFPTSSHMTVSLSCAIFMRQLLGTKNPPKTRVYKSISKLNHKKKRTIKINIICLDFFSWVKTVYVQLIAD